MGYSGMHMHRLKIIGKNMSCLFYSSHCIVPKEVVSAE